MRFFGTSLTTVACMAILTTACGTAKSNRSDRSSGAVDQTGSVIPVVDPCLALGQAPGQYPGQYPDLPPYDGGDGGTDVVIVPPKGDEPPPPPPPPGVDPCQPTQIPPPPPCDKGCGDVYKPIDQDDDYVPGPYPSQHPIDPNSCGKNGQYCSDGQGPGQWPGQTVGGRPYDRGDVEGCLAAYRRQGYDARGQWGIDVREVKNVSFLSHDTFSDFGTQPTIVIIKSVAVLGSMHFELVNPNALYCVKSSVSVLEDVFVTSCHAGNVVFGKDINVLSRVATRAVDCR